jgi:DNA (cytosine-5)-methyltransferase 1
LHTVTSSDGDHNTVAAAHLVHIGNGERQGQASRAMDVEKPLGTVVAGGKKHAAVTAFLAQFSETREGRKLNPGHSAEEPVSTIVRKGPLQAVVASNLVKLRGTCAHGQPTDEPLHTISAGGTHMAEVRAFLLKYYGTEQDPQLEEPLHSVTTKDRFACVTVTIDGEEYVIVDIGMRMLTPRELFNAQGFPPDYVIDRDAEGRPMTKTAQVAKCGNSVCPPLAEALVRANMLEESASVASEAA